MIDMYRYFPDFIFPKLNLFLVFPSNVENSFVSGKNDWDIIHDCSDEKDQHDDYAFKTLSVICQDSKFRISAEKKTMKLGNRNNQQFQLGCLLTIYLMVYRRLFESFQYGPFVFGSVKNLLKLTSPSTSNLGTKLRIEFLKAFKTKELSDSKHAYFI